MKRLKESLKESSKVPFDVDIQAVSNEWSNKFVFDFDLVFDYKFTFENVKYNNIPSRPSQTLIDTDKYSHLIENKNQIEQFKLRDKLYLWNKWSKITNPYEKIGNFANLESVTISRAFFKIYEILYYYDIYLHKIEKSLHICEAPGGFISASKYIFPNLDWHAQTLYEGGGSLKIDDNLDESRWIHNGDGDLYKLENILELKEKLLFQQELITADGGFDVKHDPNNQEQLSLKLIYAEVLTALNCQKKDGTFVCKIFDSFTRPTYQILLILKNYYTRVSLIKPRSSRYSNSEKYIVALKFKGIPDEDLYKFNQILKNWDQLYCRDFGVESKEFKFKDFKNYNTFIAVNQSWYIHQTVQHAKTNNKTISNNLETMQNKRALVFCLAFDLIKDKDDKDDKTMCDHVNITKMIGKSSNIKYLYKCQSCLQLLVKI